MNNTIAKSSPPRTAFFTIVSKNYFHYARVLMQSLEAAHPSASRFVLLADRLDGEIDSRQENFTLIQAEDLPLPDAKQFIFRYTILEFNTAVKPWFFKRLFQESYDHVVYLDPDIYVFAPLREVDEALVSGRLAVLAPHLTGRLLGPGRPSERDILQAGAYNLGFCALGRHHRLEDLLEFWCEKSVREFVVDLPRGLFTDQRWMDLVPGMFPDVHVLRHQGYDVAYWNLPHRHVAREHRHITVNGQPLVFFHFSGVDPLNPAVFSKHQDRYDLAASPVAAALVVEYCERLQAAGAAHWRLLPYAYGHLDDGSPIPDVLRKLYRSTPEVEEWAGSNPYAVPTADWNQPLDDESPTISRVMLALYQARPDIRLMWPDALGRDRSAFAHWFVENAWMQQMIPSCFVEPIRASLRAGPVRAVRVGRQSAPFPHVSLQPQILRGAIQKAALALKERRLPLSPRRWLQLYRLHTVESAQKGAPQSPELPDFTWPSPRHHSGPFTGFYPLGPGEAATGAAWMGARASIRVAGAAGDLVVIRGHHVAALHAGRHGGGVITLEVSYGGTAVATQRLGTDGPFEISFRIPDSGAHGDQLTLLADRVSVPSVAGVADDPRTVSVQISAISVGGDVVLDFSRPEPWQAPAVAATPSITVVGYTSDATGVAAGALASLVACRAAGIEAELLDARPLTPIRGRHSTTLLHVNADQLPTVAQMLGADFFRDRYNIGVWAWELPQFPDAYLDAFEWVQEIWAGSRFIQGAIAAKSSVPVVHMPYAVHVSPAAGFGRRELQLPTDRFLFLTMYDALSVQERKNPLGAIAAFEQAFGGTGKPVGLVVKVNHAASRPQDIAVVRARIAETPGIYLIDTPMSREEAQALQASCDAFVSLHRAEGFGLNIAEAMLLQKPVVVTGWSGNMDFTTPKNACLVDYHLETLSASVGPYQKGNHWAEPDVAHAAEWMEQLVQDPDWRHEIGVNGQHTISRDFSPLAIGAQYRRRMEWIERFRLS